MDGLIIKKKWLDLILAGKKTLEIRGSDTKKKNERILLLESGTGKIRGSAVIADAFPISCSDWCETYNDKVLGSHLVPISYKELLQRYKTPHAWHLTEVKEFPEERHYVHPKGAVIWVKDVKTREKDSI